MEQLKPIMPKLPDIGGAWRAWKKKQIKQFPQNNLRASSIGHPCDRYHYHAIHDWREKELHDPIRQSIFDEGKLHEKDIINTMIELGFGVVETQRAFQMNKPLITGSIDGMFLWEGHRFPFDAKSSSPYIYDEVESAEDMLFSKKHWLRKYPAQLQMYLLMSNEPVGCFILKNKVTGALKPIWMQIDYDYCEQLLKRAERVYAALAKETPPERAADFDLCMDCEFRHLCLPDLKAGPGVTEVGDQELAALIDRRAQLEPIKKEYDQIDKDVKKIVTSSGQGDKICGDWLIRVKEQTRASYTVEESSYFRTSFVNLNAAPKAVEE